MAVRSQITENSKQAILSAAAQLFLAKGYSQTSTREIAKALDMTQPALYHYFSDKQVLFTEVIKQVGQEVNAQLRLILNRTDLSDEAKLVEMTLVIVQTHPRDVFQLIHGSFSLLKPAYQRELGMVFGRDYVGPIAQLFAQTQLILRDDVDARTASSFYITSLAPLFGDFHAIHGEQSLRERAQTLVDLILYGLAKQA